MDNDRINVIYEIKQEVYDNIKQMYKDRRNGKGHSHDPNITYVCDVLETTSLDGMAQIWDVPNSYQNDYYNYSKDYSFFPRFNLIYLPAMLNTHKRTTCSLLPYVIISYIINFEKKSNNEQIFEESHK